MLGHVLTHLDSAKRGAGSATERLLEALRFHEAFSVLDRSLAPSITDGQPPAPEDYVHPAMAISCSARLLLCDRYGCNESDAFAEEERVALQTQVNTISIRAIEALASTTVPMIARGVAGCVTSSTVRPRVSPLLAYCLYHSSTNCEWYINENHDRMMYVALHHIVSGLRAMEADWRLACGFIFLLVLVGLVTNGVWGYS